MGAYNDIGDAFTKLFYAMCILLVIFVPLGIWKAIDLIGWAVSHVKVVWG